MKHITRAWQHAFLALSIVALAACGGSGGGGDTAPASASAPEPTAPPVPVPELRAIGIKTLQLSWPDTADETGYQLLAQEAGAAAPSVLASLPANTTSRAFEALLPDALNARYWLRTCRSGQCADSLPVTADGAVLDAAVGYFKAPNQRNRAGSSVALSQNGQTLAIGVPLDDSANNDPADTTAASSGAVLIFTRTAAGWVLDTYLKAPSPTAGDRFGTAVALSAQGTQLAVGAPLASGEVGAVHLYALENGTWTSQATLSPSDTSQPWRFGGALALSPDGQTLVAGMTPAQVIGSTAVEPFTLQNGTWTRQPLLASPDATPGNGFGSALALSDQGETLVVGAPHVPRNLAGQTDPAGAVYVYARQGNTWTRTDELIPSNLDHFDRFGGAVALSSDGETLAVGAVGESSSATGIDGDEGNAPSGIGEQMHGAAYVFVRGAVGWVRQAYVKAPNTHTNAEFGHAVSLSADGDALAVSAVGQSGAGRGVGAVLDPTGRRASGAAYLFRRSAGAWQPGRYIKAPNADAEDRFGASLALSGDGTGLAVGAPDEDGAATALGGDPASNMAADSGAVYLY